MCPLPHTAASHRVFTWFSYQEMESLESVWVISLKWLLKIDTSSVPSSLELILLVLFLHLDDNLQERTINACDFEYIHHTQQCSLLSKSVLMLVYGSWGYFQGTRTFFCWFFSFLGFIVVYLKKRGWTFGIRYRKDMLHLFVKVSVSNIRNLVIS